MWRRTTPASCLSTETPPTQPYPDGCNERWVALLPFLLRLGADPRTTTEPGRLDAATRQLLSLPLSTMASAATWALSSPSALGDGRAPSPRQLPVVRHCVSLPPQSCLQRTGASCHRPSRSVVVMATGDSVTTTTATTTVTTTIESEEAPAEGTTDFPEIVQTIQQAWDRVDDKYAVAILAFAGIIALSAFTGVISVPIPIRVRIRKEAIDRFPIVPGILELVGIGYTGWFVYKNLVFKPDREALIGKIKSTYNDITGSS